MKNSVDSNASFGSLMGGDTVGYQALSTNCIGTSAKTKSKFHFTQGQQKPQEVVFINLILQFLKLRGRVVVEDP